MLTQVASPYGIFSERHSWIKDFLLVAMGSLLITLCAPLAIKLPFTPVPLVLSSHVCLALGVLLGRNRAALSVLTYLAQGAMGLPVFALGASGFLHLLGPKGGYLFGWVAAAYLVGYLFEKMKDKTPLKILYILFAGNAVVFLLGVPQLALFIGFKAALLLGAVPFLIGDALKSLLILQGLFVKKSLFKNL